LAKNNVLTDLDAVVRDPQPQGALTGNAEEPTEHGYARWIPCPCGARCDRLVTPEDATADLTEWRYGSEPMNPRAPIRQALADAHGDHLDAAVLLPPHREDLEFIRGLSRQ